MCFVCLGNICRSPTAEVVMRDAAARRGLGDAVHVESAGTGSWHVGGDADPRSRAEWERRGLRHEHRARQFGVADLDRFDLVLAMDGSNLDALQRMAAAGRSATPVELLRGFDPSAPAGAEVPDPYYGGPDGFADAFDMVTRACEGVLDRLAADGRLPGGAP